MKTKKILPILIVIMALAFTSRLQAQITVGSGDAPDENALLDLKQTSTGTSTKGLLLPRVTLDATDSPSPLTGDVKGMFVYNTTPNGTGATAVKEGIYYNNGSEWVNVAAGAFLQQFYMPSIVLPTDPASVPWGSYDSGTQEFTIDLYTDVYAKQFGMTDNTTSYRSTGAGTLDVKAANELEYFIIYYDKDTFTIESLDAAGVLKYKADPTKVTEKTFMNIVFKVK